MKKDRKILNIMNIKKRKKNKKQKKINKNLLFKIVQIDLLIYHKCKINKMRLAFHRLKESKIKKIIKINDKNNLYFINQ